MMPPCARLVLLSLGSVARVTSVTGIPASARQRATVPPATPQPRISTSVSKHSLMLLPLWNACANMTQARPRELRSLQRGYPIDTKSGPWDVEPVWGRQHDMGRAEVMAYAFLQGDIQYDDWYGAVHF